MHSFTTRVLFTPPSEDEYASLLGHLPYSTGSGLANIKVAKFPIPTTRYHQRGGGLFGTLANLAKTAAPFLFRAIAPSAMQFTQDVIKDVSSGDRGVKDALRKRGVEALKGVGSRLMKGGKRSRQTITRKNKNKKSNRKRKKKNVCGKNIRDIFNAI